MFLLELRHWITYDTEQLHDFCLCKIKSCKDYGRDFEGISMEAVLIVL
jgi:hypothetical protein